MVPEMPEVSEGAERLGGVAAVQAALDLESCAGVTLGLGERPQAVVGGCDRAAEFGLDLRLVAEPLADLLGGAVDRVQKLHVILDGIVGGLGLAKATIRSA